MPAGAHDLGSRSGTVILPLPWKLTQFVISPGQMAARRPPAQKALPDFVAIREQLHGTAM